MEHQQLMNLILKELPTLMESHHTFREAIVSISSVHFADKAQTENRFDSMITRLDRSMEKWEEHHFVLSKLTTAFEKLDQRLDQKIEEDRQKWMENQQQLEKHGQQIARLTSAIEKLEQRLEQKIEEDRQKWMENQKRLENLEQRLDQKIEEDRQKWAENQQLWVENQKRQDKLEQRLDQKIEEDRQKWLENQQLWAENQQKWKENERQMETNHQQMNAKIDTVFSKVDQKLGAIGARWGIQSEASFRNALAGILKDFEEIEVIHVDEHDDQGTVFGYPEEIELDLIIKNGVLMIAEMKSSVEKFHIALFERKVRFYEQKHNRQANRKIVISPTVNDKAMLLAKQLGIEVYTYVQDVNL